MSVCVHALLSKHGVPLGAVLWLQPVTGSHVSTVHASPSLQSSAVPGVHTPPTHVSSPLHTEPSEHGVVSGAAGPPVQAPATQVSAVVHGLPSSQREPSGAWVPPHTPPAQRSPSVQAFPSSQAVPSGPATPTQVPPWQVSETVHGSPSSQGPVMAVCTQPAVGSQVSAVHGFPSSHGSGVPGTQARFWHCSVPLQTLASTQSVAAAHGAALHVQLMQTSGAGTRWRPRIMSVSGPRLGTSSSASVPTSSPPVRSPVFTLAQSKGAPPSTASSIAPSTAPASRMAPLALPVVSASVLGALRKRYVSSFVQYTPSIPGSATSVMETGIESCIPPAPKVPVRSLISGPLQTNGLSGSAMS